jgi:hypothetical protein
VLDVGNLSPRARDVRDVREAPLVEHDELGHSRLVVKWVLDNHLPMRDEATARVRRLLEQLAEEGKP